MLLNCQLETQPGWKLNQHPTGVPYYFHPCESYIYEFPPVFGQLESPVLFFKKEFAVNDGNLVPMMVRLVFRCRLWANLVSRF